MKLETRTSPHIHYPESTRLFMGDVLLAMVVIYAMSYYYYGPRVLLLAAVSVATSVLSDVLCVLACGKKPNLRDFSSVVTGMMIPLLMPATIPLRVVVTAAIFGICIAKHPFGGMGNNIFNPAAAGLSFAMICFPTAMFSYPIPSESLPLFPVFEELTFASSGAYTLHLGGVPTFDPLEMALGNAPGPMGATNILVILACLLYLVLRRIVYWQTPVFFFLTLAGLFALFPRPGMTSIDTVLYEMMSGILLFGGVFMLGDPVTSPKRPSSRLAYAILAGIVAFIFRRASRLEDSFVFVVLLMNATVWGIDMLAERLASLVRRKKIATFVDPKSKKKA